MDFVALYHDETEEKVKEANLRALVTGFMKSNLLEQVGEFVDLDEDDEDGAFDLGVFVAIPHTTDFLDIYQNNRAITFTFKPFSQLTAGEAGCLAEANRHLLALYSVEGTFFRYLAEQGSGAPEDAHIPLEELSAVNLPELLAEFRQQVRSRLEEALAQL